MKHRGEGSLEEEEAGSRSDLARSHPPARSHLGVPPVSSARCNEPDPQAITGHPQRVARSCITSIRARLREPTRSNARVCVCPRACLHPLLSLSVSLSLVRRKSGGRARKSIVDAREEAETRSGAAWKSYGGPGLMAVWLAC